MTFRNDTEHDMKQIVNIEVIQLWRESYFRWSCSITADRRVDKVVRREIRELGD